MSARKVGSVKWFNNKAGFGFITVHSEGREVRMSHDLEVVRQELTTSTSEARGGVLRFWQDFWYRDNNSVPFIVTTPFLDCQRS